MIRLLERVNGKGWYMEYEKMHDSIIKIEQKDTTAL